MPTVKHLRGLASVILIYIGSVIVYLGIKLSNQRMSLYPKEAYHERD
jgi:hypothetical protein